MRGTSRQMEDYVAPDGNGKAVGPVVRYWWIIIPHEYQSNPWRIQISMLLYHPYHEQ